MTGLLSSFGTGLRVAVIGASGGIGAAVVKALNEDPAVDQVHAFSRSVGLPPGPKVKAGKIDILREESIAAAAESIGGEPLHLVFVASGLLHDGSTGLAPEKSWNALDAAALANLFAVNATGPALVAKHFLPRLARGRKTAFAAVSARVGSISDNGLGGWYGYRASKAALNQLIKTLSVELARKNPSALCVALHPGTVDTELSKPFQGGVPDGKLFTPAMSAQAMLTVLDGLGRDDSGTLFAWDGKPIPF